ncbi:MULTISPECIES: hypothetical protein [unclassified Paenibacillus]|uniref:DUF7669 domain-containing protein n=1 Tax=unclassified Paenibacillus TaxID=185978 RepID=UPI001AE5832F|nr:MULTISPECIES: hypothetical protein [unclassified Paenibacillus]MBP1153937.1 hypothetical protein [Paenibacillus sp. PvP091]MBP1170678.1 hypothetical protein [Paenibacillus sp. PvR098]MBP2441706.1 hypothetical protein [Paenibacillus sp. PvP052]
MSDRQMVNYRDEILASVHEIVKRKGQNEFEVKEVIDYMVSKNPNYNESTIRTHIGSRCCVNANANHAVTYNDYERIGHGVYRLYEPASRDIRKLYFVDVNTRNNYLLALDVQVEENDGKARVSFFDTNRGRGFEGELLVKEEGGFVFLTEQRHVMTFRVASLEEFNIFWRRQIEGNVPDFRTNKELHEWYYKQFA